MSYTHTTARRSHLADLPTQGNEMMKIVKLGKVELPPIKSNGLTAALRELQIGEAVFYEGKQGSIGGIAASLRPAKFATRKVEGGFNVYRIA